MNVLGGCEPMVSSARFVHSPPSLIRSIELVLTPASCKSPLAARAFSARTHSRHAPNTAAAETTAGIEKRGDEPDGSGRLRHHRGAAYSRPSSRTGEEIRRDP